MRISPIVPSFIMALALIACHRNDVDDDSVATVRRQPDIVTTGTTVPTSDSLMMFYAHTLGSRQWHDSVDVAGARVALAKATNSDVRKFARTMITDHERMKVEGLDLASRLGITPIPLAFRHGEPQITRQLRSVPNGRAFDTTYISDELNAHEVELVFSRYYLLARVTNDSIRAWLVRDTLMEQRHIQRLRQIAALLDIQDARVHPNKIPYRYSPLPAPRARALGVTRSSTPGKSTSAASREGAE